jgi:hypothetical protein
VDQTPLAQRAGEAGLGGVDQAAGTIGDDQQRRAQPATLEFLQEVAPGVGGLAAARGEPEEHRLALGGDAPRSQHRLRPGAGVHLAAGAVEEQVVQLDLVQTPGRPAVELVLDRLTDPAHGGLAQRSFRAEGVGEGGLHVAHRQAAHKPSDHQRLQRIRLGHPGAKESRREAFGGAGQLRSVDGDRSSGGLARGRAVAVTGTRAGVFGVGRALGAGPAEELGSPRPPQQPGSAAGRQDGRYPPGSQPGHGRQRTGHRSRHGCDRRVLLV